MVEEVKLNFSEPAAQYLAPTPFKPAHDKCEVMIMPHERIAPEWWYRVGTLIMRPGDTWEVLFGPHNAVAGLKTTDQVVFVRDRNRHLVLELGRKADELRDTTKRLAGEIDALTTMLKGKKL